LTTTVEAAKRGVVLEEFKIIALKEDVDVSFVVRGVASGRIVVPRNVVRKDVDPIGIGEGLRAKVNANVGSSMDLSDVNMEIEKAKLAVKYGADTVMDLSTSDQMDEIRRAIIKELTTPVGTVPIYEAAHMALKKYGSIVHMTIDDIMKAKEGVKEEVLKIASKYDVEVDVKVNAADKPELGVVYLTVTGTSAEAGDDGNTGRGNRANGLITPNRYMSLEAIAGKNPVSHIGKIYNIVSTNIAKKVYEETRKIKEVYVYMLSRIGHPINKPLMVNVKVIPHEGVSVKSLKYDIESIVQAELENVVNVKEQLLRGPLEF
jgi:DNA-binding Lrp family transcriptional regulator